MYKISHIGLMPKSYDLKARGFHGNNANNLLFT